MRHCLDSHNLCCPAWRACSGVGQCAALVAVLITNCTQLLPYLHVGVATWTAAYQQGYAQESFSSLGHVPHGPHVLQHSLKRHSNMPLPDFNYRAMQYMYSNTLAAVS